MIPYKVTDDLLFSKIDAISPTWRERARKATARCRDKKKFVSQGSLWSEIKEVFLEIQHEKCCYCETLLSSKTFGKGEHDVEHFRPKSRIQSWYSEEVLADFPDWPTQIRQSGKQAKGYYKLAFDPRNYATACRTCNSGLKRDLFPIAGPHRVSGANPKSLSTEKPLLIFPLADWDETPTTLIEFEGITARPAISAAKDIWRHWRARVTIRFFHLNRDNTEDSGAEDGGRENIYRARAEQLNSLAKSLDAISNSSTKASIYELHEKDIKRLVSPSSPHTNCCNSFLRLWKKDQKTARELWIRVQAYLDSQNFKT